MTFNSRILGAATTAFILSVGASYAQEDCPRGDLDPMYCDRNGDLLADAPTDPADWANPDTLIFEFSAVQSKKVPVKPNLGYELEKQYMLKVPVKVEPDSITITGPGKILDTINFIQTDLLKLKKVSGPVIRNLIIKKTSDQLRYSESRVVIRLEVEQYTEKTLKVPVIPVNVPDSLTMKVFPAQISLSFRVVVSEFDKITHDQFRIFADYRDLVPGKENLKVILSRFPLFIEQIRLQPETVEFILER